MFPLYMLIVILIVKAFNSAAGAVVLSVQCNIPALSLHRLHCWTRYTYDNLSYVYVDGGYIIATGVAPS